MNKKFLGSKKKIKEQEFLERKKKRESKFAKKINVIEECGEEGFVKLSRKIEEKKYEETEFIYNNTHPS